MSVPKTSEDLAQQIQSLVAAYVGEAQRVAQIAVDRAFADTFPATPRARPDQAGPSKSTTVVPNTRRSREQILKLSARLEDAIKSRPGNSMVSYAEQLGMTASNLHHPMTLLKKQGRIRSVGQRTLTRYFPSTVGQTET